MINLMKKVTYKIISGLMLLCWKVIGRRIVVFGHTVKISAETVFPDYWNLRLPSKSVKSKIVKYGDFVQMHSMVDFIGQIESPATIIDVGAHHGAYAIVLGRLLQKSGRGGKIIAIEPNPVSYSVLKRNIELNELQDIVFCEQVAVADTVGLMHISLRDVQSGISANATSNAVPVEVVTLDMLIGKYGITNVDLLQIDVEGAELPVLKSFPWERVKVRKIFCEMHPYAWNDFGYSGSDLSEFLGRRRFRCFDMFFKEHFEFNGNEYIGPSLLLSCDQDGMSPIKIAH